MGTHTGDGGVNRTELCVVVACDWYVMGANATSPSRPGPSPHPKLCMLLVLVVCVCGSITPPPLTLNLRGRDGTRKAGQASRKGRVFSSLQFCDAEHHIAEVHVIQPARASALRAISSQPCPALSSGSSASLVSCAPSAALHYPRRPHRSERAVP